MIRPRALLDTSFRTKVLVPVVACMIGIMAVTFFVVNQHIKQQSETDGKRTLETADAVFRNSQYIRTRNLLLRFHNLPNDSRIRAAFMEGDATHMREPFQHLIAEQNVDVVFYMMNNGKIVDCEDRDPTFPVPGFEAAAQPAIQRALQGQETVDTIRVGDEIYDVVVIRVYDAQRGQIGVLTLGSELGDAVAQEFSKLTQSQIALLAGGQIVASTLIGSDANAQFVGALKGLNLASDDDSVASVKPFLLGGQHYYGITGRFDSLKGDNTLGYILLSSYEESLRALRTAQQVLVGVSFCAILLGATVVWFLINKATKPLRELRDSAEAVGRGDFSRRVPVRWRDECGELALVFNQMTENIQQSRAELEKTVETLKSTQAQLIQSEKLSGIGEFVAGVTHELNNPLAAVTGFSEMLRDADIDAKHRRYLDMIHKSAQRCQKIVQSLLSFARKHTPERTAVSVNSLIESALEIVQYQLRTNNIEVVTRFDRSLPVVLADSHQLQQVFLNIINNARQAIEGHRTQGVIKIITEAAAKYVHIIIQDNGPGIPEENLGRIFDPFFTTKEVGKGTGLGLSLCYGIVREHGGTITPVNVSGEGAAFIIELPVSEMAGDTTKMLRAHEADLLDSNEGAGKKILVIDDEELILNMVREGLSRHGYEVDVASDGESALRRLREKHCDMVFCDWKMAGLNGRQVYEKLRATNPGLCRRLVFVTGDVINEQMRRFLDGEKCPCLAKPFTFGELRDAIKTVLAVA
jgi:two-component system NtrC family sensor kinase